MSRENWAEGESLLQAMEYIHRSTFKSVLIVLLAESAHLVQKLNAHYSDLFQQRHILNQVKAINIHIEQITIVDGQDGNCKLWSNTNMVQCEWQHEKWHLNI